MKRLLSLLVALAVILLLGGVPVSAQRGRGGPGGGMGKPPAPMTAAPGVDSTHGKAAMPEERRESNRASQREREVRETNNVADRLARNPNLNSKLQALLPPGSNVQSAATGFRNIGQFVAAVHVSHNLNIPFDQLKAKMVGSPSMSLGQAIKKLRPDVHAKREVHKAEREAKEDMS